MIEQRRIKISGKAVVIILSLLVLITIVTAYVNMSDKATKSDGFSLTITVYNDNGETSYSKTYSLLQIEKMPSVDVHAKLHSAQKGTEEATFTGVTLKYILDQTDKTILKSHKTFIFSAGDGYSSAASQDEVAKGNNVMIAYAKNGKEMEHFNEGGEGPMKVIFAKDIYGNRSTEFLIKVICR